MATISELVVKIGLDLAEFTAGLSKINEAVNGAVGDIGDVGESASKMTGQLDQAAEASKTVAKGLDGVAAESQQVAQAMQDTSRGVASATNSMGNSVTSFKDRLATGFAEAEQIAGRAKMSLTDAFEKTGGALTAGITAPMAAVGIAATKMAGDMNAAMANIATLIPGNTERVLELKSAAQELGPEFGKSSKEVAEGLYELISTFGDSADTVKILEINVKSAAAGLATVEESIAVTSAVTKSYGDTSAEAVQKVADLAFQAVNLGKTTLPELSASMGSVTPMASTLGVSMEELFGQIAALTGVTGSTAEVTTQLRATYQAILKPSEDMQKALISTLGQMRESNQLTGEARDQYDRYVERINEAATKLDTLRSSSNASTREIKDAQKEAENAQKSFQKWAAGMGSTVVEAMGFNEALTSLASRAAGNSNELGKMFGSVEALNAVLAITGNQAQSVAEKTEAMRAASGAVTTAFDEQTKGVNASGFTMAQFVAKLEVAAQRLGDGLAPALAAVLQAVEPLIDAVVRAATWFGDLPAPVQSTIVVLAALVAAVGPVLLVISQIVTAVGTLVPAFAAVRVALTALTGALAINPVIGIVIAIVAAVTLIAANWDTIMGVTKAALDWLGQLLAKIIPLGLVEYLVTIGREIIPQLWDVIKRAFTAAFEWLRKLFSEILEFAWLGKLSQAAKAVGGLWGTIVDAFSDAVIALRKQIASWTNLGNDIISGLITGLQRAGSRVIDYLIGLGRRAIDAFLALFRVKSPSKVTQEIGYNIVQGLALGIRDNTGLAVAAAADAARQTIAAASSGPRPTVAAPTVGSAATTITTTPTPRLNPGMITKVDQAALSAAETMERLNTALEVGATRLEAVTTRADEAATNVALLAVTYGASQQPALDYAAATVTVAAAVRDTANEVESATSGVGEAIAEAADSIVGSIASMAKGLARYYRTTISGAEQFADDLKSAIEDTFLSKDYQKLLEKFVDGMTWPIAAVWKYYGSALLLTEKGSLPQIFSGFLEWFSKSLAEWATNGEKLLGEIAQVFNTGLAAVTAEVTQFGKAFATTMADVADQIQKVSETELGISSGKSAMFRDIGKALMTGMVEGIIMASPEVIEAIKKAVRDAINAAKKEAGVKSPSVQFAGIGDNLMRGLAMGIERSTGVAVAAGQAAMAQLAGTSGAINATIAPGSGGPGRDRFGNAIDRFEAVVGRLVDEGVGVNVAQQPGNNAGNDWAYAMRGV